MRRPALVVCAALVAFALPAQSPPADPVQEAYRKGDLAVLRRYAEAGDVRAQKILVIVYEAGALGVTPDPSEAFRWERMAAGQGDSESAARVGSVYLRGELSPPVGRDPKEAVRFLSTACHGGNSRSCASLARLYLDGDTGIPRDPSAVIRWEALAQDAADVERAWKRGTGYSLGYDKPPKDALEGLLRLKKAAETKADPMDLFCLGLIFLRGPEGFPKNTGDGERLINLAAAGGDWDALLFLGRSLQHGIGVSKDPAKARGWLQKAAAAGHPRAQAWLGEMLVDGEGGARDFAAAEPLLVAAQKAGEPVWALLFRLDLEKARPAAGAPARKSSIGDILWPAARDKGADEAISMYRQRLKYTPGDYDFSEGWLIYVGFRLLDCGRPRDAAPLFRLNTEKYPDSWRSWDGLGEAQAALGQTDEALAAFRRSLALNPQGKDAADQIARLEKAKADAAAGAADDALWGEGEDEDPGWLDKLMEENADKKAEPPPAQPPPPPPNK